MTSSNGPTFDDLGGAPATGESAVPRVEDVYQFLNEHQRAGTLTTVFEQHPQILGRALQSLEDNKNTLFKFLRKHRSIVADFLARHPSIPTLAEFLAQYPAAMDQILDEERSIIKNFLRDHPEALHLYLFSNPTTLRDYFRAHPDRPNAYLSANPAVLQGYLNTHPDSVRTFLATNPTAVQSYFEKFPHELHTYLNTNPTILEGYVSAHPDKLKACQSANPETVIEYLRENPDVVREYLKNCPEVTASTNVDPATPKSIIESDDQPAAADNRSGQQVKKANLDNDPTASERMEREKETLAETGARAAKLLAELAKDYDKHQDRAPSQEKTKGKEKASAGVQKLKRSATSETCKDPEDGTIHEKSSNDDDDEDIRPIGRRTRLSTTSTLPDTSSKRSAAQKKVVEGKKAAKQEDNCDSEAVESEIGDEDYNHESHQDEEDFEGEDDDNQDDDDDDDYQGAAARPTSSARTVRSALTATAQSTIPAAYQERINIPYPAPPDVLAEDDTKVRTSSKRKKGWSLRDDDCAIKHMLAVSKMKHFEGESRFREAVRRMNKELGGQERTWLAFKNFWNRIGRARSGFDERRGVNQNAPLSTSLQGGNKVKGVTKDKKAQVKKNTQVSHSDSVAESSGTKRKRRNSDDDDDDEEEEELAALRAMANGTRPKKMVKYTE